MSFVAARKHFTSRRSLGSGEIWLFHRSGAGSGLQLNEKPNEQKDLGEPAFSPDGRYVYFSQDTTPGSTFQYSKDSNTGIYSIRRIDRETGEIDTVVSGPGGAVRPQPSPDGRYLAFVRRVRFQSTLFLQDLQSGLVWPIYDQLERDMQEIWAIHGVYSNFAWTPDSRSIVFWSAGKIRRIDVESKRVSEIPFRVRQTHRLQQALRYPVAVSPDRFTTRALRWVQVSPTGDRVVFQTLGKLWLRDLPDGQPRRLTAQNEHFELYPSFSRDGAHIVYSTWNDRQLGSVRMVPADGGEARALTTEPGHYIEPVLSPDGSWLVYGKVRGGGLRSPLWSREPGLYKLDLRAEGAEPERLLRSASGAHFGAEAERLYYLARTGPEKRQLRSVLLDGSEERQHLESSNAVEIRVSNDGRWAAFSERFRAYVVPLVAASKPLAVSPKTSALPAKQVSRDAGENLHFSGDSSTVYWSLGPGAVRATPGRGVRLSARQPGDPARSSRAGPRDRLRDAQRPADRHGGLHRRQDPHHDR